MDLFTYLMNKNGNNVPGDLFSSLLGKGQSGTYQTFTGTSISANNTKKGKMKLSLKGNTSQTGTPTPSTPIPVNVVSGDNEVVVCGKNLVEAIITHTNISAEGKIVYHNDYDLHIAKIVQGKTYTMTTTVANDKVLGFFINYPTINSNTYNNSRVVQSSYTFTAPITGYVAFRSSTGYATPMLNEGDTASTYEPYNGDTYELNLGVENLFNKTSNIVNNKYIGADGSIQNEALNWYQDDYIEVKPSTNYIMSSNSSKTVRVALYDSSKTFISRTYSTGSVQVTTTSSTKYVRLSGYNNANDNVQLEIGTKANSYSPFGQTPIKMRGIGTYEDYFVRNSGKNLIDISKSEQGGIDANGNLVTGETLWRTTEYIEVKPNTTYTFSRNGVYTDAKAIRLYEYDNNKNFISPRQSTNETTLTITTTANTKYLKWTIYSTSMSLDIAKGWELQLEKGIKTLYEPYGTGQWYLKKNSGEKTLPSNVGGYNSGNNWYYMSTSVVNGNIVNANMLCNKLIYKANITDNTETIGIGLNKTATNFIIKNPSCLTQEQYRAFLETGVLLCYPLATPQYILLNDTLQEQLEDINNNMLSYEGQTNISQINNDLPFEIEAEIKVKS